MNSCTETNLKKWLWCFLSYRRLKTKLKFDFLLKINTHGASFCFVFYTGFLCLRCFSSISDLHNVAADVSASQKKTKRSSALLYQIHQTSEKVLNCSKIAGISTLLLLVITLETAALLKHLVWFKKKKSTHICKKYRVVILRRQEWLCVQRCVCVHVKSLMQGSVTRIKNPAA